MLRRANSEKATPEDRAAFREMLNSQPEKWRQTCDLLDQARIRTIEASRSVAAMKEVMAHGCEQLKRELRMEGDGALEQMLIDAAVFAWLRLSIVEQQYTSVTAGSLTLSQGVYWEKKLNAAHKRFASACTNLARVRKLLRPTVKTKFAIGQINAFPAHPGTLEGKTIGDLHGGKSLFPVHHATDND